LDIEGNEKLIEKIREEIHQKGAIPFCEFMEMALYDKDDGYYMVSDIQFGEGGDFATSTEFHPLFGKMLAKQIAQMLGAFPSGKALKLIEMGAGKGVLSKIVLEFLQREFPELYASVSYVIIERSPALRERQCQLLEGFEKQGKVVWYEDLSSLGDSFCGCLFSNELLDAFSVHRVQLEKGELKEIFVTLKGDQWVECLEKPSTEELLNYFKRLGIKLGEGMKAEVNLKALDWMAEVGRALQSGYVLTIDYGYPAKQLYTPARSKGTLLCYFRHTVEDDPYKRIGLQDMTSHLDFTSLAEAGEGAGLSLLGFTDQLSFLMGLGIAEAMELMVQEKGLDHLEVQRAQALLMPNRMGKVFKVLLQGKGPPPVSLDGFKFRPFISGVLNA